MSELSRRLNLPLLLPSQAQKHVTHNEALVKLDALVQLVLQDTGIDMPPALPGEGLIWGVGNAPSGDWANHPGELAQWIGGAWVFFTPAVGWRAWHIAQGNLHVFDGTSWISAAGSQNIPGLGINAARDSTNRLSVSSDASLFSADGTGHQLKVNKATDTDTASLLFQSGFTGHAEMGLAGNTDFSIKVSADGNTWTNAVEFDANTGHASGAAVQSSVADTTAGKLARVDFTYGPASILGAVSESAGTPTGVVIEKGSNANGFYTKYADGTLVCWITRLTMAHHTVSHCKATWTFPTAFSDVTALALSATLTGVTEAERPEFAAGQATPTTDRIGSLSTGNLSTNSADIAVTRISGGADFNPGDEMYAHVVAHGRWF